MSAYGRLSPLQCAVLDAFFAVEQGFFLSGGGALSGFHLAHRETTDLDLFTSSADAFERVKVVLPIIAEGLGAQLVVRQDAPGFRRVVLNCGGNELVVDLVRDIGPQLHEKEKMNSIVVDPVAEIFSNKLTTLVSRQEVRDLVDVMELEKRGLHVEEYLAEANAKDGGCTPATLAYLLTEWPIGEADRVPAGYTPGELTSFKQGLAERLIKLAHPSALRPSP